MESSFGSIVVNLNTVVLNLVIL